jgi:hypothetical protein
MSKVRNVFISVLSMLLITASLHAATPQLHEKLGSKNVQLLKEATHVTLLQMTNKGCPYEMILNQEEVERLKRNLLDDHNFDFDKNKQCQFLPEISFKFQNDQEEILHLFVSPICSQLLFSMGNRSIILNYDPVQNRLDHFFTELTTAAQTRNKIAKK